MLVYSEMINLARANDRRAHMSEELSRANVICNFFPAFDFKQGSPEVLTNRCFEEGPWGVFHLPNRAVTVSHALAWERFLQTESEFCLIMEDDIFISPELGSWVTDVSWWPESADIVKFERWRSSGTRVLLDKNKQTYKGRQISRMYSRHMGAAAYMISRRAAQKLLATEPFDMVVDHILFNLNASKAAKGMNIYQVSPAMAEQGNEPTGGPVYMGERLRPTGITLVRQKLKRAYYELAYPFSTLLKVLTRSAELAQITFEPTVSASSSTERVRTEKRN